MKILSIVGATPRFIKAALVLRRLQEEGIKEIIETMEFIRDKTELWLLGRWDDKEFENECKVPKG